MSRVLVSAQPPRLNRFAWLMGLYAENYQRLGRLFAPEALATGRYLSSVGDGLDVQLEVLARHRYTLELRLSYGMRDPESGQPDPSAYLRHYRDARQVEITHCYVGRHWQDVLGIHPPAAQLFNHRLQMNVFLSKWLEYLREQGHGRWLLRPVPPAAAEDPALACA